MCGIAGIVSTDPSERVASIIERMCKRLRHRGPDDEGYFLTSRRGGPKFACGGRDTDRRLALPSIDVSNGGPFDVALGHRRLSILDLSPAGHQPMASADGRFWIAYNGEIYNHVELRQELESQGVVFHTRTDTEVLLQALLTWGNGALHRLIGMFAFALLDTERGRLLLGRDFFGIKPLYYVAEKNTFAFASEIKGLLAIPSVGRRVNARALLGYLWFGVSDHGSETMFEHIRQLLPGHCLEISLDRPIEPRIEQYWSVAAGSPAQISLAEAARKVREMFVESIRLHLRSDVPVGTALSGGVDSSSIVMAVRRLCGGRSDFHSFSYIAGDPSIDEEAWVDIVAQAARTTVHKVRITPKELVADLDGLIATQDEPFGSTSIYAQHRVFRLAHEVGVKVLLDGQGADEMLAGYPPYRSVRLGSLLRQGRWCAAGAFLRQAGQLPGTNILELLRGIRGSLLPAELRRKARSWLSRLYAPSWLASDWFYERGVHLESPSEGEARRELRPMLAEAISRTSLPALLRYEDRNSMAYSVESRVPFLTPQLVEFVLSLPDEYLLGTDGTSKHVFRVAMRGIVPDSILDRRDKIGFQTPERDWLQMLRPWLNTVLASDAAKAIPALRLDAHTRECAAVLGGRNRFDWCIWRWVNVIRWSEVSGVTYE